MNRILIAICLILFLLSLSVKINAQNIIDRIKPTVVTILTYSREGSQEVIRGGSGFFIDRKGHIVTCAHVVRKAFKVEIENYEGVTYPARKIDEDRDADLAILELAEPYRAPIPFLQISSAPPAFDEVMMVLGNPKMIKNLPTFGYVRGFHEQRGIKTLRLTGLGNFGSSGSPVVNRQAKIVGVVTAGDSRLNTFTDAVRIEHLLPLKARLDRTTMPSPVVRPRPGVRPHQPAQQNASGYFRIGREYDDLNLYQEAIENYQQAIRLKPDFARAYGAIGAIWLMRKDGLQNNAEAVNYLSDAIRYNPNYTVAYYLLGLAYHNLGDLNAAAEQCRQLRRLSRIDPEAIKRANRLCK